MYKILLTSAASLFALGLPIVASAHEVYVLTANEIVVDTTEAPFDMLATALNDMQSFMFWGFIAVLTIVVVFLISIMRPLERSLDPVLRRLKAYAPAVARVTVGLGLLSSAYFQASFGPELPLTSTFGDYSALATLALIVMGTLILVGFWARAAALFALIFFGIATVVHGAYMSTYANYCGEFLVLLILGSHRASMHALIRSNDNFHRGYHRIVDKLKPYAFPLLRIAFGMALIYASLYAKVFHNNLALQVASVPLAGHEYGLAHYLGFEPHFLVLGAAIVELMLGIFFVLGLEIRFASLFLLFWLSLSLLYFGEVVWPHIILIGIPIAFMCHGYDRYSLEGRFFKKGGSEPVL